MALGVANLVAIPVTNASINPARSLAPAIYAGGWAMSQLWLFIVAPLVGGIIAAIIYRWIENR
jgi:aquaporin Z